MRLTSRSSKGYIKELEKLGLTRELVGVALLDDIKAKPQHRAFELSIAGKWLGLEVKPDIKDTQMSSPNVQINIVLPANGSTKPLLDHK